MTDYLENNPDGRPIAHFVFAHGAGAPMDHPFMDFVAKGIAQEGIRVSRFEFPYMAKRRVDGKRRGPGAPGALLKTWRTVVSELSSDVPLFIGGKSMGGRIATMIADENGLSGVICFGYPFHPPGNPEKLRTEHLKEFPLPLLIVQGERDAFGSAEEFPGFEIDPQIEVEWMPDGDHSLKPRKKSGFTESDNLKKAIAKASEFMGSVVSRQK